MGELIGLSEQATHNESTPKKAKPENATPPKKHSAKESNATVLVASKQADPYATVYAEKTNADEFAPVNTEQKLQEKPEKPKKKGLLIAIISIVLAAAIGVTAFVIWDNQRLKTNPDDYKFEIIDADYITITKYTGNDTKNAIPSEIDGYKVLSIGESAFDGCSSLTSVTIPDSVKSIRDDAFCKCISLISLTIPDSVTRIGKGAFDGCKSLTSVTIPDSVKSIGDEAFDDCESLKSVIISDSVTSIGEYAFDHCKSLTSITIPNSVTSIGYNAFSGCDNLTIYGTKGSAAEKYANDNGIEFREK